MSLTIAVVDYGMGKLRSGAKALEHVAPENTILVTSDPDKIYQADKVVFPGVGAMPDCIHELEKRGLREAVMQVTKTKPFLGICLGMQALFDFSEEGNVHGLGILPGNIRLFPPEKMIDNQGIKLKVPHIGWNRVDYAKTHPLFQRIENGTRFYFVHSYYLDAEGESYSVGQTDYPFTFTSAVAQDNLFAVQFHPEKSQEAGLILLENFVNWL